MPAPAPCAGPCINTSPPAERELGSSFHSFLYFPGLSALRAPRTSVFGALTVCGRTCAESNPLETGRGSSRGQPSPSPGSKCPGSPAVQAFRRAAHKQSRFAGGRAGSAAPAGEKVCNLFPSAGGEPVSKFGFCAKPRKWTKKETLRQKSTGLRGDPADDSWFSKIFQKKTPGRV